MRRFGTEGRLYLEDNYVVPRTEETADFIARVKQGKYIVLFAPRQTGKTTFFRLALDKLTTSELYHSCDSRDTFTQNRIEFNTIGDRFP